jgi:ubiquinone/menaquinone biosynthesis C-methylase UbiE
MNSERDHPNVAIDDETARVRTYYDNVARFYDSWMPRFEQVMLGAGRSRMCSRARGRTLEVAIGTGANVRYYPPEVELTGVDLSPAMLERARQVVHDLQLDVRLFVGDAQNLDLPDEYFDTVVATLLLSTVPDPRRAVTEMRRVLKPGGRLLLLDMTRSSIAPVRWVEQALAPFTARSRFTLLREPLEYVESLGFALEHVDRYRLGIIEEIVARKVWTVEATSHGVTTRRR